MPSWRRSLAALLRVAWHADPRGVVGVFALNVVAQLAWLASMAGIKYLFDAAVDRDPSQAVLAAVLVVGAGQLSYLFGWRQWNCSLTVTEKTSQLLDEELMAISGGLPGIEHHERPEYTDRIALVREERRRIGFAAYVVAVNLRIVVQLAGSVFLLVRLHPLLLLLPGFALVSFLAQTRAQRRVDTATEATAGATRRRRELFDLVTSAPGGKELRVFGLKDELMGRHRELAEQVDDQLSRAAFRSALLQASGRIVFAVGYLGAIGLVLQRAVAGPATAGDVALAITLAAAINAQVAHAAYEFAYLRRMVAAAKHYVWLLDYAACSGRENPDPAPVPDTPVDGLLLEAVSFRYPGTEVSVLDGISFRVPAGGTVALVGENGSGKTTLAKLLLAMYEPDDGTITLDGIDIRRFDLSAYRNRVSAAFQDYCRFEFRVRESVGVGDLERFDDDRAVLAAIEGAGAEDVLTVLGSGLDTQLGRAWDGVELSGGQWQKLAVSRALMRTEPALLVCDEPTAALDPFSEHLLFERIASQPRGMTVLVSHRFSTVRMADWIVVLRGGRVVEAGTHDELVALRGLYAELYSLQANAYR